MNIDSPEIHKLLDLIASKDYDNIVLALTIDKSIGIDIAEELMSFPMHDRVFMINSPSSLTCHEAYQQPFVNWDNATKASLLLQKDGLLINNFSEARHYDALIFCQNLTQLAIDFKSQEPATDFRFLQYMHLKQLDLRNCPTWFLNEEILGYLAKQGLETLMVRSTKENTSPLLLPKALGQLKSLKNLFIEHHASISIPEEILNLTDLNELYLHNWPYELQVPDKLLGLPQLKYAYLNHIPQNTFAHLNPQVELDIRNYNLQTIFQLMAWKRSYKLKSPPVFNDVFSTILYYLLRINHLCLRVLPSAPNQMVYYLRALFLSSFGLVLLPFGGIYFILSLYGKLPDLYLQHFRKPQWGIVEWIAASATRRPSSIEGLGPMGCFGGIAILLIFFWSDALFPFLCRYLFLPLAIIFYPVDLLIRLFVKK